MTNEVSRRDALERIGQLVVAVPAAGIFQSCGGSRGEASGAGAGGTGGILDGGTTGLCVLTSASTEGPFYFDPRLARDDITEGLPGAHLKLGIEVVDILAECAPIEGAIVDVWHCDAQGRYSGYSGQGDSGTNDTRGEAFLRGVQTTDRGGSVSFRTIYPGWYGTRTAHVHFKVHLTDDTLVTSQIYFDDDVSRTIFAAAPYDSRSTAAVTNAEDHIFNATPDNRHLIATTTATTEGYAATLRIGVRRSAG